MYLIDIVLKLALYENTLPAGSQVPVVSFLRRTLTFSSPEPAEYSWLTCYASLPTLLRYAKPQDMKSLAPYSGDKTMLVKLI